MTPALAQVTACMPAVAADAQLRAEYGEAPTGRGVAHGRLVLLYTARDGATWTVMLVDPRTGVACAIAEGEGWEPLDPPRPEPEGDPS